MKKIDRFRRDFFSSDVAGAALVLSDSNRFYLSEFNSSDGAVLITPDSAYLIVDFRYYEMALLKNTGFTVILAKGSLLSAVYELTEKEGIHSLAVEDDYVTISLESKIKNVFKGYDIAYIGDTILKMRAVKTEDEIRRISNSQSLTDTIFNQVLSILSPRMTENDVAAEIEYRIKKEGAVPAFETIAVTGTKSSLPHGVPDNILLSKNAFLTMDFGAKLDGYCSDMTRTVVIGKADSEMKELYSIVLEAQLAALDTVKANVRGSDVDLAARSIIDNRGYKDCFGHATGHSLGVDIHESPNFSPRCSELIPQNAVLSVEPGIYIDGKYGVRIEDIVVVGEKSALILTKSSKNLIEI